MSEQDTFYYSMWRLFGAVIVATAAIIVVGHVYETKLFVDSGYRECILPGSSQARWCKP